MNVIMSATSVLAVTTDTEADLDLAGELVPEWMVRMDPYASAPTFGFVRRYRFPTDSIAEAEQIGKNIEERVPGTKTDCRTMPAAIPTGPIASTPKAEDRSTNEPEDDKA